MATLLELRRRVKSVKNMRQITRAMKLVSAAKLRRAQDMMLASRPYSDRIWDVLGELGARAEKGNHALLTPRREDRVTAVILASDRGLCGSFNSNVLRYAHRALAVWDDQAVELVTVGKRAHDHFRRASWPIVRTENELFRDLTFGRAAELAQYLVQRYVDNETDAVYLIYNEFVTVLRQNLVVEPLVPIRDVPIGALDEAEGVNARAAARAYAEARTGGSVEGFGAIGRIAADIAAAEAEADEFAAYQASAHQGGEVELIDYIYEPCADDVLEELLPRHVESQVYRALLESLAAEHAARMAAMENATKNAEELIEDLTLTMNKIRQEEITTEILEVVGGAAAQT